MAVNIEASAENAIRNIASLNRVGQVQDRISVGRHPLYNKEWEVDGQVVGLEAVRDGAIRLSEDDTVKHIALKKNTHLVGLENAVSLIIDRVMPEGDERLEFIFKGNEQPDLNGHRVLVERVLGNIADLKIWSFDQFKQEILVLGK